MRRIGIAVALVAGGVVVVRALAPRLHARMMAACKGMFERMPDDFPPKRMMSGIDEIRANTARTLELLEGRKPDEGPEPFGEGVSTRAEEPEMVHA